jgi:hypothetical protein
MSRQEWNWKEKNLLKLEKAKEVIEELKQYKPLTLRQIYYQLVGKGYIDNNPSQYIYLSKLLKFARIDGLIEWEDMEDRSRVIKNNEGDQDKQSFLKYEYRNFLLGYRRDFMQTQENYIEVWIEKDALSSIFNPICIEYGINLVICRGFSSTSFLLDFKERISTHSGPIKILYFGDFDPSGMEMIPAMETTVKDEMKLEQDIEYIQIALTKKDCKGLIQNPDSIKAGDTRAKKFIEEYGEHGYELDAMSVEKLTSKLKEAIEENIDLDSFTEQKRIWKKELKQLNELRNKAKELLGF